MAWTNPTTVSTSDPLTAALWNSDVADNGSYLYGSTPSARVYHNTTQSIATGADRIVTFNSERWDNDAIHDNATNPTRLTCKTAGKYMIMADIEWATAPATAEVSLLLNGTTKFAWYQMTNSQKRAIITGYYDLAVNDYVELVVNPATTQTINSTANYSPEFMMYRTGG